MAVMSFINLSNLGDTLRMDAEYYQPKYLELERRVRRTDSIELWKQIRGEFITGPFGSEFIVERYVEEGTRRYVRGRDVKDFFLLDDENVYIPKEDFERLKKYALQKCDILISVVGTLGNASVVDKETIPAIFSCKSTVFRSSSINPYYLIAYLNSKYGRSFLERKVRGHVQTGLNIGDLKSTPIFVPSESVEKEVAGIVQKAKENFDVSKSLYSQSLNLLLKELGIEAFQPQYDLSYINNIAKTSKFHRLDAEYFQPVYRKAIELVETKSELEPLQKFLLKFQKGVEVGSHNYEEDGKPFFRVSNLSVRGFVERDQKYVSEELYQQLRRMHEPETGEFLLTKDATPGIAYVVKESIEGIIASGILKLRIDERKINSEYLALCINSIFGRLQIERDCAGSVIKHWRPERIKRLKVPILAKGIQKHICSLVKQSHEAGRKAKELLEIAKDKTEKAIENKAYKL